MAIWVLDASHGGSDPGIVGNVEGRRESDIVLEAVIESKRILECNNEEVILIRECNEEILFEDRIEKIKNTKGDYYISFNMNSNIDKSVTGVKVFYLKKDGKCDKLAEYVKREILLGNKSIDITVSKEGSDIYDDIDMTTILVYGEYLSNDSVENSFSGNDYGRIVANACLKMIKDRTE